VVETNKGVGMHQVGFKEIFDLLLIIVIGAIIYFVLSGLIGYRRKK
jgi:hypothetical protein